MGISNNAPTMSYIHISGTSVVWNNETYMVQDFATNKRYIYWNADTPHQLNASNVMPNRSTKQYLVIVNDNGMHSLVPSTSDDFSISFEGNSNQAIKDRIFGLYEKNEEFGDKFVAIEQDIDGIKSIVGETEETTDGTLIDRMSKIEQRADEINLSVEEVSKKYNDDKETNELRENLNSSIIKLNSTLGTFKSELTNYFKNNEVSSEEQVKIKTQLEILKNNKIILEGYVNTVRLIAESNNQTQDVVALDSAKKSLQIAHDNLHNNVTNAIIDSIISPTENTIIIDSFAKYNLKINELKNTCDDIIILGVGGVITEELANISIKSNEIKLSVSKVEEDFKNDMSIQKLELEGQIRDVNSALGTFEETVNTTFKDGIIDESEKSLLKEKINLIDKEKVDIDLRYNSIYSDTNLSTDIKSELKLKYNNYSNKHSELKSKIESVISDSLINDTEKKEVDTLFKQYANTLAYFHDVINKAIENIAFNSSNAELKKAKEELQNEVSDVSDSVNDLSDTMHGAFQDGILSESEKIAIRQNLSILASEKSDIDKQYTTIYANADLTGTPKTNLKTAYDNYVVSYNSLISTINTILGKSSTVNSTDRNNLTNAFNTHNTKLGLYTVSANNALDSIATKKAQNESSKIDKKYADIILNPETGIVSKVEHINQEINGSGGITDRISLAESKITETAITNTVKKNFYTKGDIDSKGYQTSSQVQQTVDSLQFKFSQSGGYNLIRNSAFKNGLKYWTAIRWDNSAGGNHNIRVEQVGNYWTISNRSSINAYVANLTSNSLGKPLNAGFDSDLFPVNEGSTYTLNCLLAVHRAYGVTIEMLCYNSNGDRLVGNNSIYISGIKMGGKDRNNWTPVKHTFTTQQGATHCRLRLFLGEWTGESDNVHVWLAEPIVTEGSSSVMWTPSADEVYDGITIIDKDGIQVQHHDNSFSRFNSSEMYQTNENGDRALSIRHGGYRVYQFDYNGNTASAYLGSIASTYLSSGRVYGTGIFGTANSGYIDIGFSESSQDNQHTGISPWLRCSHYDGASGLPAGIHSFKPFYAHDYSYYYARPRFFYGIAFPYDEREDLNEEISNITTSSSDTSSIGSRYLNIWGADGINIGVQNNGNYTGHKIIEDSSGAKLHHESWGDWDFHWWTMRNINIANTLSDPSALIDSREHKYTRESHNIMSTKKLIQDRGEDFTMDGSCIVEIPNDIKYSISRYDVNIIKYGRGDIWVSERTHDYFVVESENDIKFTWVLEGETLDTSTVSSITPYNIEEDSSEIKPKTREVFGTIPSSKYATMDD